MVEARYSYFPDSSPTMKTVLSLGVLIEARYHRRSTGLETRMETRQLSINIHRALPPLRSCSIYLSDVDVDAGKELRRKGGNKDGETRARTEKRGSRAVPNNCQLFQARSLRRRGKRFLAVAGGARGAVRRSEGTRRREWRRKMRETKRRPRRNEGTSEKVRRCSTLGSWRRDKEANGDTEKQESVRSRTAENREGQREQQRRKGEWELPRWRHQE